MIIRIERDLVTLKGPQGTTLTLHLKHRSKTPIQREANLLFYKKKKKNSKVPVEKSVQSKTNLQPAPVSPQAPEPNTSKPATSNIPLPLNAPVAPRAPTTRISGALQRQTPQPAGSISGARTTSSQPRTHVSGR